MAASPRNILAIDDSSSFRDIVSITLTQSGYHVELAADGVEALKKVDSRKFDLIVCDLNMPNMNGIDFVKAARTRQNAKFTPVLMLTTETRKERMDEAKAVGVSAWLSKPFAPSKLLHAVSTLTRG